MIDPLSAVLGTFEGGEVEFTYLDVVKAAGHSCPTVGGAYLMTVKALEALYPDTLPVRGMVKVAFKEPLEEGVAGVIGNVISQVTGATDKSGFKGLGGNFARHSLMGFGENIGSSARFTRVDTGACVDVHYNPSQIPGNPNQQPLMQKIMQGVATNEDKKAFGTMWQERVGRILIDHVDDETMIRVEACS
ncbi:MAG: hypothetical protein U9Q62_00765 [Campylobacterota bacterium]|nr:hypothetical protein [Campylobacterota bacterium]